MATLLRGSRIIDRWASLITGANGKGNEIYKKIEQIIKEQNPPQVHTQREMVSPNNALKGLLLGKKREYIIVSNDYLISRKVFIGARNYGNQLAISWYLVNQTRARELVSAKRGTPGMGSMDPFDLEELTAYTATIHHAVLEAVEELCKDVDFDFTKVDKKSKGFLNVS